MAPLAIYYGERQSDQPEQEKYVHMGSQEPIIVDSGRTEKIQFGVHDVGSIALSVTDGPASEGTGQIKYEAYVKGLGKSMEEMFPIPETGFSFGVVNESTGKEIGFKIKPVSPEEAASLIGKERAH